MTNQKRKYISVTSPDYKGRDDDNVYIVPKAKGPAGVIHLWKKSPVVVIKTRKLKNAKEEKAGKK